MVRINPKRVRIGRVWMLIRQNGLPSIWVNRRLELLLEVNGQIFLQRFKTAGATLAVNQVKVSLYKDSSWGPHELYGAGYAFRLAALGLEMAVYLV